MPELPTLNESGVAGYDRSSWVGLLAPAAVSKVVITRLNAVVIKVVNTVEMKAAFGKQGFEAQATTPEKYAIFINNPLEQNAKLIRAIGRKPE